MDSRDYLCLFCFSALWIWLADGAASGTKCYKNEEIGEYPDNIYYCQEDAKPECCEEDSKFTCCETKSKHVAKDQIILWGCVFGAVGCITFIWICYRKDTYLCEGSSLVQRCRDCTKKDKKVEEEELTVINSKTSGTSLPPNTVAAAPAGGGKGGGGKGGREIQETSFGGGAVTARSIHPIMVQEAEPEVASASDGLQPEDGASGGYPVNETEDYGYDDDNNYYNMEDEYGNVDYPGYPGYEYGNHDNGEQDYVDPDNMYNPVIDDEFTVGQAQNVLPPIEQSGTTGGTGDVDDPVDDKGKKKNKGKKNKKEKKKKKKSEAKEENENPEDGTGLENMEDDNLISYA